MALVPLFLVGQIGFVLAEEKSNSVESATWQFEYNNDVFFKLRDLCTNLGNSFHYLR